jgi:hypothetical protein
VSAPRPGGIAAISGAAAAGPPPWHRDLWFWLSLLAVVPLILHMRGAPWGVPVADDFDYLHRVMLSGRHSLLDGCGSIFYWRPFSRQIYFEALWRVMLASPAIVAWLHVGLLALTSAVLYRTLRVTWSAPAAWVAATFPLLAESSRMLITWPSNFQDLAAMLFAAIAIHATVHRRLALALGALLLSLLSKEVGVLAALLLPWLPQKGGMPMRERLRWASLTGALVAAWGVAYVAVSRSAGLVLPSQLERDPVAVATPLVERVGWALWNSARSAFSLPSIEVPGEQWIWTALAAVLGDPVAERLIDGVFECLGTRLDRHHLGTEQPHPRDVERLPRGVDGTHVDDAFEAEQCAGRRRRHAVLTGTRLGDDPGLAHLLGEQSLTQDVVDLVGSRVVQILPLQQNPHPEFGRQVVALGQR